MLQIGQNEFGHQGLPHEEELDNGNRIQNRNRVLHAGLGRFLQRDPLGYVDAMSLYQYVRGNPITFLDRNGHESASEWVSRQTNQASNWASNKYNKVSDVVSHITSATIRFATPSAQWNASPWVPNSAGEWAMDLGKKVAADYNGDPGVQNAAQHLAWQAALTAENSYPSALAIGDAHEANADPTQAIDTSIDYYNNVVGRNIGTKATTRQEIEEKVREAIKNGDAITSGNDPRIGVVGPNEELTQPNQANGKSSSTPPAQTPPTDTTRTPTQATGNPSSSNSNKKQ